MVSEETRTVAMMQTPVNTSLAIPLLGRELRNLDNFQLGSSLEFFLFVALVIVQLKMIKIYT